MNEEVLSRIQNELLKLYKEFNELACNEEISNLKDMAANGLASAIGSIELIKVKIND